MKQAAVDDPENYYYRDFGDGTFVFYGWNENAQRYTGGLHVREE